MTYSHGSPALVACMSILVVRNDKSPGSDGALVSGSRFDWTVRDPWRELCKFPKDPQGARDWAVRLWISLGRWP